MNKVTLNYKPSRVVIKHIELLLPYYLYNYRHGFKYQNNSTNKLDVITINIFVFSDGLIRFNNTTSGFQLLTTVY